MDIIETLNQHLLAQSFDDNTGSTSILIKYKHIAQVYAAMENAIVVLSDLKNRKSYIYQGKMMQSLGLANDIGTNEIESIWEAKIFDKIHPDDMTEKHLLELRFFRFLKDQPVAKRSSYYLRIKLRMQHIKGHYVTIQHRMFYVLEQHNMRLALCLYSFAGDNPIVSPEEGIIVNSVTGETIKPNNERYNTVLSTREKEILHLIAKGNSSKAIAHELHISINTVNRHRQNILEKLKVKNSIEACRIAELMGHV